MQRWRSYQSPICPVDRSQEPNERRAEPFMNIASDGRRQDSETAHVRGPKLLEAVCEGTHLDGRAFLNDTMRRELDVERPVGAMGTLARASEFGLLPDHRNLSAWGAFIVAYLERAAGAVVPAGNQTVMNSTPGEACREPTEQIRLTKGLILGGAM